MNDRDLWKRMGASLADLRAARDILGALDGTRAPGEAGDRVTRAHVAVSVALEFARRYHRLGWPVRVRALDDEESRRRGATVEVDMATEETDR